MTPCADIPVTVIGIMMFLTYLIGAVTWYRAGRDDEKVYWHEHLRKQMNAKAQERK